MVCVDCEALRNAGKLGICCPLLKVNTKVAFSPSNSTGNVVQQEHHTTRYVTMCRPVRRGFVTVNAQFDKRRPRPKKSGPDKKASLCENDEEWLFATHRPGFTWLEPDKLRYAGLTLTAAL